MNNDVQIKILEKAQQFVDEKIAPNAELFDKNELIPLEIIKEMGEMGFLGAVIPQEYGGLGMDALYYGRLTEIFGKACSSTRALLTVHTSLVAETLLKRGNDEQKERYLYDLAKGNKIACFALTEPNVGSDASAVETSYIKEVDSFVLNGCKKFISFGAIADLFLVIASEAPGKNVSAFLVERGTCGIETKRMTGLLGSRAAYIAEIKFDNVVVPSKNLIGNIGMGFSIIANTALFYGRYSIAWSGLSIAQAALELMSSYALQREQFGQKIGQSQLVQKMIADATTNIHAARCLCEHVAHLRIQGSNEAIMETNIAKYFTSRVANEVTNNAIQVLGGNGCIDGYGAERLFREAKIMEIIEGTSQMQQILIAKNEMKKYRRIN